MVDLTPRGGGTPRQGGPGLLQTQLWICTCCPWDQTVSGTEQKLEAHGTNLTESNMPLGWYDIT